MENDLIFDEDAELEYRVKWDIGTNGASTAFYIQRPAGVRKQVEKLRHQKRQGIVVQARPVGEWLDAYDDEDLQAVFGLKTLPPDWRWIDSDEIGGFVAGYCSKFPGLAPDTPEYARFYSSCMRVVEAGSGDLPTWSPS